MDQQLQLNFRRNAGHGAKTLYWDCDRREYYYYNGEIIKYVYPKDVRIDAKMSWTHESCPDVQQLFWDPQHQAWCAWRPKVRQFYYPWHSGAEKYLSEQFAYGPIVDTSKIPESSFCNDSYCNDQFWYDLDKRCVIYRRTGKTIPFPRGRRATHAGIVSVQLEAIVAPPPTTNQSSIQAVSSNSSNTAKCCYCGKSQANPHCSHKLCVTCCHQQCRAG